MYRNSTFYIWIGCISLSPRFLGWLYIVYPRFCVFYGVCCVLGAFVGWGNSLSRCLFGVIARRHFLLGLVTCRPFFYFGCLKIGVIFLFLFVCLRNGQGPSFLFWLFVCRNPLVFVRFRGLIGVYGVKPPLRYRGARRTEKRVKPSRGRVYGLLLRGEKLKTRMQRCEKRDIKTCLAMGRGR